MSTTSSSGKKSAQNSKVYPRRTRKKTTPINQACNKVKQLKCKQPKKLNILEFNKVQYKDSKSTVNKIGNTLVELYLPQKYDPPGGVYRFSHREGP